MTEHIIALPYWCRSEVDNFLQVLDRWPEFCKTDVPYRFILAKRFDTESDPRLLAACEKFAPAEELNCLRYPWQGWPSGANGMFRHTMEHAAEHYGATSGFVFWFEHDVIPIQPDWLQWLHKDWDERYSLMGHFVTQNWINEYHVEQHYKPYFSGSACYNKQLMHSPAFLSVTDKGCFDVRLTYATEQVGNLTKKLWHMFDLYFFMPPWAKRCDVSKLMLNGAKDYKQRAVLIDYILENR